MIAGDLQPRDLPGAWADGLQALIGVVPASDREGVLQDIHWYDGNWGYFPTYTLGALIAAQLFVAARAAIPGLAEGVVAAPCAAEPRTSSWAKSRNSAGSIQPPPSPRPMPPANN